MAEYRSGLYRRDHYDHDKLDSRNTDGWSAMMDRRGHSSRKRSRSRDRRRSSPSHSRSRSHTHSRSRSRSRTPDVNRSHSHSRSGSRSRSRSRSPGRRSYDRSLSPERDRYRSPPRRRRSRSTSPLRDDYENLPRSRRPGAHKKNERPCRTLIVRNICDVSPGTAVDKEQVEAFFTAFGVVRGVRVPVDRTTQCPRGYAFVEFETIDEATAAVEDANANKGLDFGGRVLSVEYSLADSSAGGQGVADWACSNCSFKNFARRDLCHVCGFERKDEPQEDFDWGGRGRPIGRDHVRFGGNETRPRKSTQGPNSANYVYDKDSGWFYDPQTRYYVVDADSNIFYDGASQRYLKYDTGINCYVPTEHAASDGQTVQPATTKAEQPVTSKSKTDGEVHQNSEKPSMDSSLPKTIHPIGSDGPEGTGKDSTKTSDPNAASVIAPNGPVNFALKKTKSAATVKSKMSKVNADLERWTKRQQELQRSAAAGGESTGNKQDVVPKLSAANSTPITATPAPPLQATPLAADLPKTFIKANGGKVICELCRRGFKTVDIARKHEALSNLHKKNLEERAAAQAKRYRDRAAERRQMHPEERETPAAATAMTHPRSDERSDDRTEREPREEKAAAEAAINQPQGVGATLLKAMGWKEGAGLGIGGEGISAPIEASGSNTRAGLGSEPSHSTTTRNPADTPKERSQQLMERRWKNMFCDDDEDDEDGAS